MVKESLSSSSASESPAISPIIPDECPICWQRPREWVHGGTCGHCFCRPCLERLLLAAVAPRRDGVLEQSETVIAVARNVCPVCRKPIHLFDVVQQDTGEPVYHSDNLLEEPLLCGAVFAESGQPGMGSFSFPPFVEDDTDVVDTSMPYYDISRVPNRRARHPKKVPFENVTLHSPSRTFAGDLQYPSGYFHKWHVILTFSDDWQFIRSGIIIKCRRPLETERERREMYPMDGGWKLHKSCTDLPRGTKRQWEITGNIFTDGIGDCHSIKVNTSDKKKPISVINQARQLVVLEGKTPFDWTANPQGPPAGTEWELQGTSAGPFAGRTITWIREAVSAQLPPDETNALGGRSGRNFTRVQTGSRPPSTSLPVPLYHPSTIWGNVFCQGFMVGLASYHFVDIEHVYISYEHPATGQWPSLDNGMPVPSRVQFHNISFPDPHTFRGEICWERDYGTPWQGSVRWEYEMNFDFQFTCIVGGIVESISEANTRQPMSTYGSALIYINAAMYDKFLEELAENDAEQVWARGHGHRLAEQNARARTVSALHAVFVKACLGNPNPIDFNNGTNS